MSPAGLTTSRAIWTLMKLWKAPGGVSVLISVTNLSDVIYKLYTLSQSPPTHTSLIASAPCTEHGWRNKTANYHLNARHPSSWTDTSCSGLCLFTLVLLLAESSRWNLKFVCDSERQICLWCAENDSIKYWICDVWLPANRTSLNRNKRNDKERHS